MGEVQPSRELDRVLALPRREWTAAQAEDLARRLTSALSVPTLGLAPAGGCLACKAEGGTPCKPMALFPLQAVALAEIATWGGAVVPIPVGFGKTLVSGLAGRMVKPTPQRILLLVPAHLAAKTERELAAYRRHWILPPFVRIQTYQTLSQVNAARFLEAYQPDLIVADEAHYLKNPRAACTRRVARYLKENRTPFVVLTGTLSGTSLRDFSHLSNWALPLTNPCPEDALVLEEWCRAVDVDVPPHRRLEPGALAAFSEPGESDVVRAFGRRLRQTPGMVTSAEPQLPIPIRIQTHRLELDEAQADAFSTLRRKWQTPDLQDVEDGVAMWRHARELSTGFYSVWVPRPPDDWRDARRDWARACREILAHNRRHLDTELQLTRALDDHPEWYPEAAEFLARWREIEPTFTPNPVPHWISDRTINWIAEWARESPGLIWVDRPAVGERLAARHGLAFYSNMGIDPRTGAYVEAHDPRTMGSCVVSRKANDSGRNLQAWSRNLVVDVPPGGTAWEQLIGRTHRRGQLARLVTVDVAIGSIEDLEAFWKAHGRAIYARSLTGQPQKLLDADLAGVATLDEAWTWHGPQWEKTT